jgi:23S rRNA pseudouridine1911/1915/1917 synthase
MVFAKNARAKKALMENWNSMVKRRSYVALVEGAMGTDSGTFDSWLVENRAGQMYEAAAGTPSALRAVTLFRVIGKGPSYSLLELDLETGRKHQIRAQLSAAGHPVAGDSRYGAESDPLGRLCLHAWLLILTHPFKKEEIRAESSIPKEFNSALGKTRPEIGRIVKNSKISRKSQ